MELHDLKELYKDDTTFVQESRFTMHCCLGIVTDCC